MIDHCPTCDRSVRGRRPLAECGFTRGPPSVRTAPLDPSHARYNELLADAATRVLPWAEDLSSRAVALAATLPTGPARDLEALARAASDLIVAIRRAKTL